MRRLFLFFFIFSLILNGIGAQAIQQSNQAQSTQGGDQIIVFRLPNPEKVYINRDGSVVYEATIPANAIVNNTFILPDNAQLESIFISQGGKRVNAYTTFIGDALVLLRSGERPYQVRVLHIVIPGLTAGQPLNVNYSIRNSGLSWNMLLDLDVVQNNSLNSTLVAELRSADNLPDMTKSILARNPEIIIVSATNALLGDASAFFNLGRRQIEANRRQRVVLEEGTSPYKITYYWDTTNMERPIAYLRAQTPLKTMAGRLQYYLYFNGMVIDNQQIIVSPSRPFDIPVGEQGNLVTYRAAATEEFPDRENYPYTHNLEFRVENNLSTAIDVEIMVPAIISNRVRTVYVFTNEPDERPNGNLLWKYNIPAGQQVTLKFSYNTDLRNHPSYRQYEYSEGGR
jgi:hypothetical protein